MTDEPKPKRSYAECLREVKAAFDELAAEAVTNLHAPVGPITVDWGEWDGETVVDVGGFARGKEGRQVWPEWLACNPPVAHPWLEALRADIVARGVCCTGSEHQSFMAPRMHDEGSPERVVHATFSYRGWGSMLAAIWNSEHPENAFDYNDFAHIGPAAQPLRADGTRVDL